MALLRGGLIGGSGGSLRTHYGTDGRLVRRIRVWAAYNCIKAIDIWLTDDVQRRFGDPTGNVRNAEFTFSADERVTRLSLWGNGIGTRSGWLFFRTSRDRVFDFGMFRWSKQTEFPQNVGSGIWAGIRVRSGHDIDALAVVFFKPIRSCTLRDVVYRSFAGFTTLNSWALAGTITSVSLRNSDTDDQKLAVELTHSANAVAASRFTLDVPASNGLMNFIRNMIGLQARTPALVWSGQQIVWETSRSELLSSSIASNITTPTSYPWNRNFSLESSQTLTLSPLMFRGTCSNLPFNGTLRITATDGGVSSISFTGRYNGTTHAYEPRNPNVIPSESELQETTL